MGHSPHLDAFSSNRTLWCQKVVNHLRQNEDKKLASSKRTLLHPLRSCDRERYMDLLALKDCIIDSGIVLLLLEENFVIANVQK